MATKKPASKGAAAKKAAPAKTAPRARQSPAEKMTAALATHGFPRGPGAGLGFTGEDDALFERGYPHMRILVDTPVDERKLTKEVEAALDAIDPVLRIRVPRGFAAAYLRGYRVGPLLFVDRNHPAENAERRADRTVATASNAPITVDLLRATLREGAVGMGRDTYGRWRLPEVLHLYEHFVGTEAVARAVVDHLVHVGTELETWGFAGDPGRLNAAPHALALALPWILRRVEPKLATELRGRLAAVKARKTQKIDPAAYFALLGVIAHPERAELPDAVRTLAISLAMAHDRPEPVRAALEKQPRHMLWGPGRFVWLLGSAFLAGPLPLSGMPLAPLLDSMAPLRDPGVVRAIAHIGAQRAGARAAAEWLAEHADYARPILETLSKLDDPKEAKVASKALDLLAGAAPPAAPTTEAELEKEIAAIFERLGEALRRSNDREAMVAHIREAHEAYTEARAAVGDPTPDAYFTHRFGDFGLGQWAMIAVDAI